MRMSCLQRTAPTAQAYYPPRMNSDHQLILQFLAGDGAPMPVDSNPLAIDLGATLLEIDAKSGTVMLGFEPTPRFLQGNGVIQGGIVTTMLDFAIAFAALAKLPESRSAVTVSLNVHLVKPAPPGRYVARGTVKRMGGKLAFMEAELRREEEVNAVATATAVMAVLAV